MINSKKKGNAFECAMAARLREIFPNCYSQRFNGSLWNDASGIDLTNTGNFNIQCKAQERLSPGYHEILKAMPQSDNVNVILHKKNHSGIVAVLDFEDFLRLIKRFK